MSLNPKLALVVEDDPLQRAALSELLQASDVDVIHCESAEAGELVIIKMGPQLSLLIADVKLAGAHTGLELAEFARSRLPHLKIIVVSGKNVVPLPSDICFVQKPWRPGDLLHLAETEKSPRPGPRPSA